MDVKQVRMFLQYNHPTVVCDSMRNTAMCIYMYSVLHYYPHYREIMPLIQDSCVMCHLMPEWREEDERAFVHCGIQILNKGLNNTICQPLSAYLHEVTIKWWMTLWKALWQTHLDVITWFRPEHGVQMLLCHPPLSTLANATVASNGTCHMYPVLQ